MLGILLAPGKQRKLGSLSCPQEIPFKEVSGPESTETHSGTPAPLPLADHMHGVDPASFCFLFFSHLLAAPGQASFLSLTSHALGSRGSGLSCGDSPQVPFPFFGSWLRIPSYLNRHCAMMSVSCQGQITTSMTTCDLCLWFTRQTRISVLSLSGPEAGAGASYLGTLGYDAGFVMPAEEWSKMFFIYLQC